MVADVIGVWPHTLWTVVHVRDKADGVVKRCQIWMMDEGGRWMAARCKRALEQQTELVLTVKPPVGGEYEIEDVDAI